MKKEFEAKVHSPDCYLEINILQQEDGTIALNQTAYIKRILDKFGMTDCKLVGTPVEMKTTENQNKPE